MAVYTLCGAGEMTIYLMSLVDYPQGRKAKITCANCNYVAKDERELDSHMKKRTYIITKLYLKPNLLSITSFIITHSI